jgi:hypothetical protein
VLKLVGILPYPLSKAQRDPTFGRCRCFAQDERGIESTSRSAGVCYLEPFEAACDRRHRRTAQAGQRGLHATEALAAPNLHGATVLHSLRALAELDGGKPVDRRCFGCVLDGIMLIAREQNVSAGCASLLRKLCEADL